MPKIAMEDIHFWLTDLKIFLKEPLAPMYTNFEGERAPKKTQFFGRKIPQSKKCLKTPFSINLLEAQKIWSNLGLYSGVPESTQNQFGRLKKKRSTKF